MKYLKSTTLKAYTVNGKLIPANTSKDVLELDEAEYHEVSNKAAISSLIKAGGILVTDTDPRAGNAVVSNKVAELTEKLTKADEEKKAAVFQEQLKYKQLEAEARQKIAELEKQLEEAKKSE